MPATATCFNQECAAECDGFTAYCPEHQPVNPEWWKEIHGKKQSQCAGCRELFTTVRTFDSHQSIATGSLVCQDPKRMFTKDGRRRLMLTTRGWAKNADLEGFNTFSRKERS